MYQCAMKKPNVIRRPGFSFVEMLVVMALVGVIVAIASPKFANIVRHQRVNRATSLVVADLQNVFAMAGRQRAPVRISSDSVGATYTFEDRKTGAVLQTRYLGKTTDYALSTLVFSPATLDMFPNGISSAPLTVKVGNGNYVRTVTASTAGFVRMVP